MGLFDGILLVSDYDGTLADSQGVIPFRVEKALREFTNDGGRFTVCTGRSVQGFHAFDKAIMNAPVLCANGAVAYDYEKGETVFSCGIDACVIPVLRQLTALFPFVCVEMYNTANETYVYHPDLRTHNHLKRQQVRYYNVFDFDEVPFPLVKIMLGVGTEKTAGVQAWLGEMLPDSVKFIPDKGEYIELLSSQTDKGQGMLRLADLLGIGHERVFAVGDGANDVDMLLAADAGFVPANADEYAKQAGTVMVCSNDDGAVAEVVETLALAAEILYT